MSELSAFCKEVIVKLYGEDDDPWDRAPLLIWLFRCANGGWDIWPVRIPDHAWGMGDGHPATVLNRFTSMLACPKHREMACRALQLPMPPGYTGELPEGHTFDGVMFISEAWRHDAGSAADLAHAERTESARAQACTASGETASGWVDRVSGATGESGDGEETGRMPDVVRELAEAATGEHVLTECPHMTREELLAKVKEVAEEAFPGATVKVGLVRMPVPPEEGQPDDVGGFGYRTSMN